MSIDFGATIWRTKNIHTAGGILLLSGIVIAGHLLPGLDNSEIENGLRNALHILVFAAFAVIVFESMRRLGVAVAIIVTMVVTGTVAGLAEFLQYSAGKQPDFFDLARDVSGTGLALIGWSIWRRSNADGISDSARIWARIGAVLVAILILTPLLYWLAVIALNRSTFPTIVSFDDWWERHLYYSVNSEIEMAGAPNDASIETGSAIELSLSGWGRSGLAILPVVSDWTAYEYLTFTASMVKGPETSVTVRINDENRKHQYADRFIARISVTDKPERIRIPIAKLIVEEGLPTIDISDIQEIVIFARDNRDGSVMMLDDIRLE